MLRRAPLRATKRLRAKPRKHRESALRSRVRLDAKGMAALRLAVFERSGGFCEQGPRTPLPALSAVYRCWQPITWEEFELSHIIARSQGGSDTMENCRAWCKPCHKAWHGIKAIFHGEPQWTRRTA